jgi:hypothetical protein
MVPPLDWEDPNPSTEVKVVLSRPGTPKTGGYTRSFGGPLAQLVEQGTLNPKVAGSIPARPISSPLTMRNRHGCAGEVCAEGAPKRETVLSPDLASAGNEAAGGFSRLGSAGLWEEEPAVE